MTRGWRLAFGLLIFGIVAGLVLVLPRTVDAHANLLRASPGEGSTLAEPPDRIITWFSEPLAMEFSELRVLDSAGARVDTGGTQPDPTEATAMSVALKPLEDGIYSVVWKNTSTVDGHTVRGSYFFAVGVAVDVAQPVQQVPLLQSGFDPWQRWLLFAGASLIIGGMLFELTAASHVLGAEDPASPLGRAARMFSSRLVLLLVIGLVLVAVGSVGQLLQQARVSSESSWLGAIGTPSLDVITKTNWGRLWAVRSAIFVAAGIAIAVGAFTREKDPDSDGDVFVADTFFGPLTLLLGLAALGVNTLMSHSAAAPADVRAAALANDFLHSASAAVWAGGLVYFACTLPALWTGLTDGERMATLASLIGRFSPIALTCAGVLVITGLFAGWVHVTVPSATASPYGWTLVGKVLLVGILFGAAAVNAYVFRPRAERDAAAGASIRRLIVLESVLVLAVLLGAGWVASLEPARAFLSRTESAANEFKFAEESERVRVEVSVSPLKPGYNTVGVRLRDTRGEPITNAIDVRARLVFREQDLGATFISGLNHGDGNWIVHGLPASIGGGWQVEVLVVRPDGFDARAAAAFEIATANTVVDRIRPTRQATLALVGAELALGGVLVLLVITHIRPPSPLAVRRLLPVGFMLVVAGIAVSAFVLSNDRNDQGAVNPVLPTEDSIASGRIGYFEACARCHGLSGLGDGPDGAVLNRRPADLTVHVPLHPDIKLFEFIRDGIPASQMPGQRETMTDTEIWDLVNYLRAIGQSN